MYQAKVESEKPLLATDRRANLSTPDENSSPLKIMTGPLGLGRSGAQHRLLARLRWNGGRGQGGGDRRRSFLPSRLHQTRLAAVLQPIALSTDVDHRRVMQQPVQNRRGDDWIAENRTPVGISQPVLWGFLHRR